MAIREPSPHVLAGRIGAYRLHATHDPVQTTAKARASWSEQLNRKLLAEIDPNQQLSKAERARRLEYARKAH